MSCDKRGRPREEVIDVEWHDCEFRDTGVLGGEFFPRKQVHPLSLAADATYKIYTLSDVPQSVYVTVISGALSLWFTQHASDPRPDGSQAHMEFVSGQGPKEFILPPGEHSMVVGAANDAACVATVCLIDREAHRR